MKLSNEAYNALNTIAEKTKMDCWFWIEERENEDVIRDLENGEYLTMKVGLSQFAEGIIDPLDEYGLSEDEKQAVIELFDSFDIEIGG